MSLLRDGFKRDNKAFMDEVEKHQRAWGERTYKGRPTLQQLLDAVVVAFWYPSGFGDLEIVATIHNDTKEIDEYITHLVWYSQKEKMPHSRLSKVFVNQQEIKVKAIRVIYSR